MVIHSPRLVPASSARAALGTGGRRPLEAAAVKFQGRVSRAAQPAWGRVVCELDEQVTQVSDTVRCEPSSAMLSGRSCANTS